MTVHEKDPGPSAGSVLSRIAAAVILVWLGITGFVALGQQSMIYFPSQDSADNLDREGAAVGLVPWRNEAGTRIGYASLVPTADSRPAVSVLVCHGNAGYAVHRAVWVPLIRAALPDHAVSVWILEYPGYGARPGKPSQKTMIAAAEDALGQLPRNTPVIGLGESIGTGVVSALAAHHPSRLTGLVLVTPFDSLANVARHHYPLLPVSLVMRDKYPAAEWLRAYDGPVALIVAGSDRITPPERASALAQAYHGPKLVLTAPEADHNDVLAELPLEEWRRAFAFVLGAR